MTAAVSMYTAPFSKIRPHRTRPAQWASLALVQVQYRGVRSIYNQRIRDTDARSIPQFNNIHQLTPHPHRERRRRHYQHPSHGSYCVGRLRRAEQRSVLSLTASSDQVNSQPPWVAASSVSPAAARARWKARADETKSAGRASALGSRESRFFQRRKSR
jgi:hypothetical protein